MTTLIVVPTYNEAGTIHPLLDRIRMSVPDADILVVDDNSPDGTADRAEQHSRVHVLRRPSPEGLGAAYRAGFAWALDRPYTHIVQMDADLSHPPEALPPLLAALADADVAIGSRYVPGGRTVNWPLSRRLLSRAGNAYIRLVLGLSVRDTTAGLRAFRADALRRLAIAGSESNGYCFQVESTWRAQRRGLKQVEVPIIFTERRIGVSKMSPSIALEAVLRVLSWRAREIGAALSGAPVRA